MKEENDIIPIEENRLYFLFKRGEYEHIKALYEEGEIYINTIDYIRTCDDNQDRSDKYDSIMHRFFSGKGKIIMCDVGKDINVDGKTFDGFDILFTTDYIEKGNIYCLAGIYSESLLGDRNTVTFNMKTFGDTIICIHNPRKFLERLSKALMEAGYTKFYHGQVEYYSNNYSGNVGFFKKHERFKEQMEYRIFVPNKLNEPIKLKIGSLEDIAVFNKSAFQLKYTDGKEQIFIL